MRKARIILLCLSISFAAVSTGAIASVIPGEGTIRYANSAQYMTHGDAYANLLISGSYSTFGVLPGRVLKYANLSYVTCCADLGSSITNARAHGWLLHDRYGQELHYQGASGKLLVNPGNSSYLSDLRARILTFLAAHPFVDGIFFDNFLEDVRGGVGMGINYPVYTQSSQLLWSSPSDFQASELTAIHSIGSALRSLSYLVVVSGRGGIYGSSNNDNAVNATNWLDRYAPYVSGTLVEYWLQNHSTHAVALSNHATAYDYWNEWEALMSHAYSHNVQFWPGDYTSTSELRQCRYLRASFLLNWNGYGSINLIPWSSTADIWDTCTAFDPGLPTGSKQLLRTGVWRRYYQRGYVIVNTTASTVSAGGYTIASGDAVLHQS